MHKRVLWILCFVATASLAKAQPSNSAEPRGASPAPLQVHLVCDGTGTYQADDGTERTIPAQVFVDIAGDSGRIKIPTIMIPVVHSGPADEWRAFNSISISEDVVKAKFTLNFLNKPRVNLDRQTGHIDMTGLGVTFNGSCHPYGGEKVF